MAKLSMTNNPITNAKKRYWLLEKRIKKLSKYRNAQTGYEGGIAAFLIINTDPTLTRALMLQREMRKEQRELEKFIRKYGYCLA